jgi:hypothetical protein
MTKGKQILIRLGVFMAATVIFTGLLLVVNMHVLY